MTDLVGRTLADRFRIDAVLGVGGMATVYRAHDGVLDVAVAVKVLSSELVARSTIRMRFLSEARLLARLRHDHIVTVLDFGEDLHVPYIVMEYLPGGSLDALVTRDGPLPLGVAATYVDQLLAALEVAHAEGVVHRDIKPHNLLLDARGRLKLADFGIAHPGEVDSRLTRTGAVMGTLAYMAPEQRSNAKDVDQRADLYAVAATLFVLVTGREPLDLYVAEERAAMTASLPEALRAFVDRATRYRPDERYPTATAMRAALHETLTRLGESFVAPTALPTAPTAVPADNSQATWSLEDDTPAPGRRAPPGKADVSTLDAPPDVPVSRPALAPRRSGGVPWRLVGAFAVPALAMMLVLVVALPASLFRLATPKEDAMEAEPLPPPTMPLPSADPGRPAPRPAPRPSTAPRPSAGAGSGLGEQGGSTGGPIRSIADPRPAVSRPIRVTTRPAGTVVVDGHEHPTPWSGHLRPGVHTLIFRDADGVEGRLEVTVAEGDDPVAVCWDFAASAACR